MSPMKPERSKASHVATIQCSTQSWASERAEKIHGGFGKWLLYLLVGFFCGEHLLQREKWGSGLHILKSALYIKVNICEESGVVGTVFPINNSGSCWNRIF